MNLITDGLKARFAEVGSQDRPDAVVIAHYFTPTSNWDWYATEYDPETNTCFGLVKGFETELGYFSLTEMAEVTVKFLGQEMPGVERDLYWHEMTLLELRKNLA